MKFIHSADWQIGMRFRQFGTAAEALRAARVRTLRRALEHAAKERVEAFLIAGDLFEDNQIEAGPIREVFDLLAAFSDVRIFILPGNHDPCDGPGCIWQRPPFSQPPAHLTIFREAVAMEVADGWLLANPLTQKKSTVDPSLKLAELAASLPSGALKIGLTHGSPAIESQHQPDDFPIALDAATRAGLDYLAIGHWHGALSLDGGRLMMPGTPEQTKFDEAGAGCVQRVEIASAGSLPKVTTLPLGELRWQTVRFDFADVVAARAQFAIADPAHAVVQVILEGETAPAIVAEQQAWIEERLGGCVARQIVDRTTLALSATEVVDLRSRHPLLAEVLDELRALGAGRWNSTDLQTCAERCRLPLEALDDRVAAQAQRWLLRTLREVTGK